MVIEETSKFNKLKDMIGNDIIIPTNDLDAWLFYKKHNWVYNKLEIAKLQGIDAAPMPIIPRKFPVILKPIINLYGMGLNVSIINNEDEFIDKWYTNHFWMEYLDGIQYSFDVLLINGIIQWHCCFKGYKLDANLGSFRYWDSTLDEPLPANCHLILDKLDKHTGCVNFEVINGIVIECHLRMGDISKLPDERIFEGIVSVYKREPYDFPQKIPTTYLFPIWITVQVERKLFSSIDANIIKKICSKAYSYQIDKGGEANPSDLRRIMMITTIDYGIGLEIVDELYRYIHSL